jgi:hypothetical protein
MWNVSFAKTNAEKYKNYAELQLNELRLEQNQFECLLTVLDGLSSHPEVTEKGKLIVLSLIDRIEAIQHPALESGWFDRYYSDHERILGDIPTARNPSAWTNLSVRS